MTENIVLDSSAIFALTDDEPGADQVQGYVLAAIAGSVQLYCSFVTLTEVEYIILQEEGEAVANQRLADLKALPIAWLHSDGVLCSLAAKLKAAFRISFADFFVAATAQHLKATLIHKDPEFHALASLITQKMLPPK